jgi:hypothetical protein
MNELLTVAELKLAVESIFRELLKASELETLRYDVESIEPYGQTLSPDHVLTHDYACLKWDILGETGRSGNLRLSQGADIYLSFIRGDLQEFISESRFAWGEWRA